MERLIYTIAHDYASGDDCWRVIAPDGTTSVLVGESYTVAGNVAWALNRQDYRGECGEVAAAIAKSEAAAV